jgi:hypothetical protein
MLQGEITMSEEEMVVEAEQVEKQAGAGTGQGTVTEEIKVQAQDLFKAINDLVREATVRRITIMRNDRVLVDIPLAVGVGASMILAFYLPVISALAAVGALLSGCTLRVEREEPPA